MDKGLPCFEGTIHGSELALCRQAWNVISKDTVSVGAATADTLTTSLSDSVPVDSISRRQAESFFAAAGLDVPCRLRDAILDEFAADKDYRYSFEEMTSLFVIAVRSMSPEFRSAKSWSTDEEATREPANAAILVDSTPRVAWTCFVLLAVLVHETVICFQDGEYGIHRTPIPGLVAYDWIMTCILTVDIFVCAFTADFETGRQMPTKQDAVTLYWRSWSKWIIDVLAAQPLDVILNHAGAGVASGVVSHLRMLKILTTPSYLKVSGRIPVTSGFIFFFYQCVPLAQLIYFGLYCVNILAAVFLGIRRAEGQAEDTRYITSVYLVIQTCTTVGFGDVLITSKPQRWFAVFLVITGLVFNALVIGRLITMIQLGDVRNVAADKLRETMAVLDYFSIPKLLQVEILGFQAHALHSDIAVACNNEMAGLPDGFRTAFMMQRRVDILRTVDVFRDDHDAVMYALATSMIASCCKPEEYVSCCSEAHKGIRFLLFGFVDKLDSRGRYIITLKSGDYFGLDGLYELRNEEYNLKALSYCDLLVLPANEFHAVMAKFPKFQNQMKLICEGPNAGDVPWWGGSRKKNQLAAPPAEQSPRQKTVDVRKLRQKLRNLKQKLQAAVDFEQHGTQR